MVNFSVCVACLATDIKMHSVRNTLFQEIYENLANVRLNADRIPETVCYICYSQLLKCYRFISMSQRAGKILTQLCRDGIQLSQESVPSLNDRFTNIVTTILEPTFIPHESDKETVNTLTANKVTDSGSTFNEINCATNEEVNKIQVCSIILKEECLEMDEEEAFEDRFVPVKDEPLDSKVESTTEQGLARVKQENVMVKIEDFVKEVKAAIQTHKGGNKMSAPGNNTAKRNKILLKAGTKITKSKKSNKGPNIEEKSHACNSCERKFSCKAYLARHLRVHTGEKPFVCKICDKTFSQTSHLVQHMRLHTGEKPYSCHLCKNKAFNHRYNYETHMRKHFGVPSHTCNICSSAFHQKGDLKRHIMTHTGEKPYTCDTCQTKFSQRCHLTKHARIHSREKPYACSFCEASFAQKNDLVNHLKIHNGERPFPCTYQGCSKKFRRKGTLNNHLKVHTKERPFACDKCDKSFKQKAHLTKHTSLLHANNLDLEVNQQKIKQDPDIQQNQYDLQQNKIYLLQHEEEYIIP